MIDLQTSVKTLINQTNPDMEISQSEITSITRMAIASAKKFGFTPDEASSAVLLGIWKALDTFDPSNGANVVTWARWQVKGELKTLKCHREVDALMIGFESLRSKGSDGETRSFEEVFPSSYPTPEAYYAAFEGFRAASASLSEAEARCFEDTLYGWSVQEQAAEQGISDRAVIKRLHNVRRKVGEALARQG